MSKAESGAWAGLVSGMLKPIQKSPANLGFHLVGWRDHKGLGNITVSSFSSSSGGREGKKFGNS